MWIFFVLFAMAITLFIGALQTGLIRPYYRNSKVETVKIVADLIEETLLSGRETKADETLQVIIDNDACAVIYNDQDHLIYDADSIGVGCVFHSSRRVGDIDFRNGRVLRELLQAGEGEYSMNVENTNTRQEMIVYGRKVSGNLANYYMFINSPLEPVDSIVTFFTRQYMYYMLAALIVASMVSFVISRGLTRPIVEMEASAERLSGADYSVHFDGGTFTETKELAHTLNTATDKLSRIDTLRRDLIANVSHDIKTPLTDIRAYAEMIRDISGNDPAKREKHLDVIIKETEYMNNLVNDMSELAKMQSGNYHPYRTNMDLSETIRDILDIEEPQLRKNSLSVNTEIPESLTVYADEIKIGQVIANYMSNAIKHSREGDTITVRAWLSDDEETVHVEVEDQGEGIAPEEIPNIWDRYQKSSGSFSRNVSSTGLGLAIVKAILDAHHGRYGVESEVGKGSCFWFELKETHEA